MIKKTKSLSEKLKILMEERGMSQADLVKKTGINKGALSSYISGRYQPRIDKLELLADALSVPVNSLLGTEDYVLGDQLENVLQMVSTIIDVPYSVIRNNFIHNPVQIPRAKTDINGKETTYINLESLLEYYRNYFNKEQKRDFAERFSEALKIRKLKQETISYRTEISKKRISDYKTGKQIPNSNDIEKISIALKVNKDWLRGFDVPMDIDWNNFFEYNLPSVDLKENDTYEVQKEKIIFNLYNKLGRLNLEGLEYIEMFYETYSHEDDYLDNVIIQHDKGEILRFFQKIDQYDNSNIDFYSFLRIDFYSISQSILSTNKLYHDDKRKLLIFLNNLRYNKDFRISTIKEMEILLLSIETENNNITDLLEYTALIKTNNAFLD